MTARYFKDWITSFLENTGQTEAPQHLLFWCGISAVAGCLRRKVWLDFRRYQWYPNFYIILVAKAGIISKSTTADLAMDLLKAVPGIKFGPDIVTWPALVQSFAASAESFQIGEEWHPMSPLTLVASELGNLIDPQDKAMINLYINLWDGRKSLEKITKGSGNDIVEAPWINMLGCTTPHWIADNMPAATVGGGFTSRCIFVYADRKERSIAYGDEAVAHDYLEGRRKLVHDLEYISLNLCGEYKLAPDARKWGVQWYENLWDTRKDAFEDNLLDGYIARKQTHMHKLAMVLAASQRNELVITLDDLTFAESMLAVTEDTLPKVFARIGKSDQSLNAEQFIGMVKKRGALEYSEAYRLVHTNFPGFKDFEDVLSGAVRAGFVFIQQRGDKMWIIYNPEVDLPQKTSPMATLEMRI